MIRGNSSRRYLRGIDRQTLYGVRAAAESAQENYHRCPGHPAMRHKHCVFVDAALH